VNLGGWARALLPRRRTAPENQVVPSLDLIISRAFVPCRLKCMTLAGVPQLSGRWMRRQAYAIKMVWAAATFAILV